jgi:hypothetical protein
MGFYQDQIVPILTHLAGRQKNLAAYRGRVVPAAEGRVLEIGITDIERSSFIKHVCYDDANRYMLISLNGTYYHYCEIDSGTVTALLSAESIGRFYNANIRGLFDCRSHRVPAY